MADAVDRLAVYLHLARASERRQRPHVRDRLLVLAAVAATKAGLLRIAAYCRHRVMLHNAQHLIRRWPTVSEALRDPEFQHFLTHLEKRYSSEHSERLLQSLNIDLAREREAYYSDEEYAAAIVGVPLAQLAEMFPEQSGS